MISLKITLIKKLLALMLALLGMYQTITPRLGEMSAPVTTISLATFNSSTFGQETASQIRSTKANLILQNSNRLIGMYADPTYGVTLQIININQIPGGVEIFARAWKGTSQYGFGEDGSVDIERFKIYNPPILVSDPNGTIVDDGGGTRVSSIRKMREDPVLAIQQTLAHTIKVSGQLGTNIISGKVGHTTATFFPDPGDPGTTSINGQLNNQPAAQESLATIRNDAGTSFTDTAAQLNCIQIQTGTISGNYTYLTRTMFLFDTSSIGSSATVNSATFSVASTPDKSDLQSQSAAVVSAAPSASTTLTAADYAIGKYGTTEFASRITIAAWAANNVYNDFSLNASGIANISKRSADGFALRISADIDNSTVNWAASQTPYANCYGANQAGTSVDPKLVVTYTAATVTPINNSYILIFN